MENLYRMLGSRPGFVEAFWKEAAKRQKAGEKFTHEGVFEYLDEKCQELFGYSRFPSFEAFRKFRDRRPGK